MKFLPNLTSVTVMELSAIFVDKIIFLCSAGAALNTHCCSSQVIDECNGSICHLCFLQISKIISLIKISNTTSKFNFKIKKNFTIFLPALSTLCKTSQFRKYQAKIPEQNLQTALQCYWLNSQQLNSHNQLFQLDQMLQLIFELQREVADQYMVLNTPH